jgi:hypothetical protein
VRIILRFAVSYWACGGLTRLEKPVFSPHKNAARRERPTDAANEAHLTNNTTLEDKLVGPQALRPRPRRRVADREVELEPRGAEQELLLDQRVRRIHHTNDVI